MAGRNVEKLTDKFCATVKPRAVQAAYPDGGGLELRVSAEGAKAWSLRYRTKDGAQRRITLGSYDESSPRHMGLKAARARRLEALVAVDQGGDLAIKGRDRPGTPTRFSFFNELAEAYFAAQERAARKRPSTMSEERGLWRRHLSLVLGNLPIAEVTRARIKLTLRAMADRGLGASVNRAHAVLRQIFAWGVEEFDGEVVASNPAREIRPLAPERSRERVLTESELRRLWTAFKAPGDIRVAHTNGGRSTALGVGPVMGILLRLAMLLPQRRGELAHMALGELDLKAQIWTIPADRMKGKCSHVVPLPDTAMALISQAMALRSDPESKYVFPSPGEPEKPIRADSVTHAMDRFCRALQIEDASTHDLRRTIATMMTGERLGIRRFVVSKLLAHSANEGAAVTAVYDRNEYLPDKRRALAAWEQHLLEIVGERTPEGDVVQLAS